MKTNLWCGWWWFISFAPWYLQFILYYIFAGLGCQMEKAVAPHSSVLARKIPWTEEPGRLQSRGRKELDMTEWLRFHISLSCIGEGNGNPLQCSCLENPRDGGAWWAAVYGTAQGRIRLKRRSSSSRMSEVFPGDSAVGNPLTNVGGAGNSFNPWVGKIPWRRVWWPTPVFLPGESHGQRSMVGHSPWCYKELDMTEFMTNRWRNNGNNARLCFLWAPKSLQMVTTAMKLKDTCSLEEKLWQT